MFEQFSKNAIKVIMISQQESRRLEHDFVGTEQLLLGLIAEENGIAATVLTSMGITFDNARSEVEKLIGRGSKSYTLEFPFTPRCKAALEMAAQISRELSHPYIGSEHLLLGILREGERILNHPDGVPRRSVAFQVLENLGLQPLNIRDRVIQNPRIGTENQGNFATPQESFSMQPYQAQLQTILPPMSNQAIQVWHTLGSQIGWEETNVAISKIKIMRFTLLSEAEVKAALDELISLKVIRKIEDKN
jgi:ATP-dependent Clp protease ATP-binding subunit ClpC